MIEVLKTLWLIVKTVVHSMDGIRFTVFMLNTGSMIYGMFIVLMVSASTGNILCVVLNLVAMIALFICQVTEMKRDRL